MPPPRRVALVHYWLVGMRGGERVLEEMLRLYPEADIFTHVVDRDRISPLLAARPIIETGIARLPGARRHYQKYLSLMPRALEELDMGAYDLVLSSESGPAKGVIARPDATHVCYCHSPMRYIWDHYPAYRAGLGGVKRRVFSHLAHGLRQWDVTSAARVDRFVANSRFVAGRIHRAWGRESVVVHPPVDLEKYGPEPARPRDHYLFVSELVAYKRADLAVEAFRGLDLPLKVVGQGEESARLARDAPPNVEMLGRVGDGALADLYRGARALIFPGEEDFGIVPVEAMACGTPVIAFGRGGALDSVRAGVTGTFFEAQEPAALRAAVTDFDARRSDFDAGIIAAHARGFGAERFRRELAVVIESTRAAQSARFSG
ncbi:glycosyltransferase [Oceaniglobus trochenteri]|uniref:glycosyltransferase n=1 Tax=Oceaniglobus trochenteri TaxID=2763260 RepID=UPI001CFFC762|nr:glycosyltransferase [Oceaniglobus trochenteri]